MEYPGGQVPDAFGQGTKSYGQAPVPPGPDEVYDNRRQEKNNDNRKPGSNDGQKRFHLFPFPTAVRPGRSSGYGIEPLTLDGSSGPKTSGPGDPLPVRYGLRPLRGGRIHKRISDAASNRRPDTAAIVRHNPGPRPSVGSCRMPGSWSADGPDSTGPSLERPGSDTSAPGMVSVLDDFPVRNGGRKRYPLAVQVPDRNRIGMGPWVF